MQTIKQLAASGLNHPFVRDYGMIFVLLLLVVIFSILTAEKFYPKDAAAGRELADRIVAKYGADARVVIVTRVSADDRKFAQAIADRLGEAGAKVVLNLNSSPADARGALEELHSAGAEVDAVATNDVVARWTIWKKLPEEITAKRIVPPSSFSWPIFLKSSNLQGVASAAAIPAIIAIGMTMVIITGGIDLSVGSLVALASVTAAVILRDYAGGPAASTLMVIVACIAGAGLCALAGVYHGALVTTFRVPAFVVTLGMMMMARGLARRISDGTSVSTTDLPSDFFWLGGGKTLGIANPILLMIVLYVVAHVIMTRTRFGRYIYAIGGNEKAAWLSGVPVRRVLIIVYTICGALAGLGGVTLGSQLKTGNPTFGMMLELEVIAAVVVGGTSLLGGRGKIFGTLIGAFIIAVIKNGMNLTGVDPDNQLIVLGAVLTGAVLLDALKQRGGS